MEKKDALTLACENLATIFHCKNNCSLCYAGDANHDDINEKFCKGCAKEDVEHGDMECENILKQHFQQQATIPDGWDVVKEIYKHYSKENKELEKEIKSTSEGANKFSEEMAEMLGVSRLNPKCINELAETKLGNLLRRKDNIFGILSYIKEKLEQAGIEVNDEQ